MLFYLILPILTACHILTYAFSKLLQVLLSLFLLYFLSSSLLFLFWPLVLENLLVYHSMIIFDNFRNFSLHMWPAFWKLFTYWSIYLYCDVGPQFFSQKASRRLTKNVLTISWVLEPVTAAAGTTLTGFLTPFDISKHHIHLKYILQTN